MTKKSVHNSSSKRLNIVINRIILIVIWIPTIAFSAWAQGEQIPQFRVAAGYANLKFPFNDVSLIGEPSAGYDSNIPVNSVPHSGLFLELEWDPTSWLGIENYTGIHNLDRGVSLLANIPGGKIMSRNLFGGRVIPYAVAGFGIGFYTERGAFSGRTYQSVTAAARYGVGTDVQLKPSFGLRVDASRMALNLSGWTINRNLWTIDPRFSKPGWYTNWNFSAGVIFTIF